MAVWANASGGRTKTYSNHSFVDVAWVRTRAVGETVILLHPPLYL